MKTRRCLWLTAVVVLAVASFLPASTHIAELRTCPLCETEFEFFAAMSGTQLGMMLDGRPTGFLDSPWPVPVCPSCGMVLLRDSWTVDERQRLRVFVATDEYRSAIDSMTSYYLAAILLEHLDAPCVTTARAYLKASWQEQGPLTFFRLPGVEPPGRKYRLCAEKSLEDFDCHLALQDTLPQEETEILCAELERRLGRFEAASARLKRVLGSGTELPGSLQAIAEAEVELVALRDSLAHSVPREKP